MPTRTPRPEADFTCNLCGDIWANTERETCECCELTVCPECWNKEQDCCEECFPKARKEADATYDTDRAALRERLGF